MDKYIIIKKRDKMFYISYIYYDSPIQGQRVSKNIGVRHKSYNWISKVFNRISSKYCLNLYIGQKLRMINPSVNI